MVAQQVVCLPHSNKVPSSIPRSDRGLSVWSLHGFPSGHSSFLPQSENVLIGWIGDCKLAVGMSVNGCMSLYVALWSSGSGCLLLCSAPLPPRPLLLFLLSSWLLCGPFLCLCPILSVHVLFALLVNVYFCVVFRWYSVSVVLCSSTDNFCVAIVL